MNIPGYTFDGKRYYKILPGHPHRPALAAPPNPPYPSSSTPSEEGNNRKKAKRRKEKGKERAVEKVVRVWPNAGVLNEMREGPLGRGRRVGMHHELESVGMSSMRSVKVIYPDCLPLDDDILRISFDSLHSHIVRVGGSSGVIATGSLLPIPAPLTAGEAQEDDYYYSMSTDDNQWRSGWCFPSAITSLNTCGERILATCLGAPAQAIIGTTTDTMSLASVTLSPRKTSLWTSALTKDCIALGCDTKVLTTRDPASSSHSMDGYVTGSRHGGGAVFALDIHRNSIFAGVRSGHVKMFDMRSSPTQGAVGREEEPRRSEIDIKSDSSVTHLKYLASTNCVLVAGLDGTMALYDPRHHQRPLLTMKGHKNQYTRDVGFDVWRDEFVAAAGQDNRVRIWSLRTGNLIPPPSTHLNPPRNASLLDIPESEPSLLIRQFASPVKALKFREGERGQVELWVGDGGALECFEMKRN